MKEKMKKGFRSIENFILRKSKSQIIKEDIEMYAKDKLNGIVDSILPKGLSQTADIIKMEMNEGVDYLSSSLISSAEEFLSSGKSRISFTPESLGAMGGRLENLERNNSASRDKGLFSCCGIM